MNDGKVILFNPAISSMNEGDHIIFDGVRSQINGMFPGYKQYELPTQMPVSKKVLDWYKDIELRFVCGTNILKNNMLCEWGRIPHFKKFRQWDVNLCGANLYGPVILVGCGWQKYQNEKDLYSKLLWNKLLSTEYKHSVRDAYTQQKLSELGITNTINTGCPTLWSLTKEHCKEIPAEKANNVVTTITDYSQDLEKDQMMLNVLSKNYDSVYLWLQGYEDDLYAKLLSLPINCTVISGGLSEYDKLLGSEKDIEFVGTRLHGGIRALQHKKRTTFIAIDNRTIEMGDNFGLNYLRRTESDELEEYLLKPHKCNIVIPEKEIEEFKSQFRR